MAARIPISSEDAEHTETVLLGSLLLHPEAAGIVQSLVQPGDFTTNRHRLIYETILIAVDASGLDAVNEVIALLTERELEDIGGLSSLMMLKQQAEGVQMPIEEQASLLKKGALSRQYIQARERICSSGGLDDDLSQVIRDLEQALSFARQLRLPDHTLLPKIVPLREVLGDYLDKLNEITARQGDLLTGVPTGFVDLDAITGGLQRSDLIIVAGPPSVGKTGFALSIALHALQKANRTVGLFSLEASRKRVVERLLAMEAHLDQRLFHTLEIVGNHRDRLRESSEALMEGKLWIDDTASLSTAQLYDRASFLVEHCRVELIIVDYVHLMLSSVNDKRHENRVQEVGEISRSLKSLARELDIPVLALAQLSRAFEGRPSKKFQLSDLRDGSLENDADLVLFLSVAKADLIKTASPQLATISIAKNRHGPRADLDICFYPASTRFRDLQTLQQQTPTQSSSSVSKPPLEPGRPFPRLQAIMQQAMQRRKEREIQSPHLSPRGRELPQGSVLEDEGVDVETT